MKMVIAVTTFLLLGCSTAVVGWAHEVPAAGSATLVHSHYPVVSDPLGPTYAYPAPVVVGRPIIVGRPVVTVPPRAVYRRSYVVAPRATYRARVVVGPRVVYPAPVVVRPKVYVLGQPVRNAIRAVTP
jgi:hypothetical protein